MKDDKLRIAGRHRRYSRKGRKQVALMDFGRISSRYLDRSSQVMDTIFLTRPNQRFEPSHFRLRIDVQGIQVQTSPPRNARLRAW